MSDLRPAVLVTGGRGYLGSRLVSRLSPSEDVALVLREGESAPEGVGIMTWSGDPEALSRQVRELAPGLVIHLAAHYRADAGAGDVAAMIDASVSLTAGLLYGLVGPTRMVVVGTRFQRLAEGPINVYSVLKQCQEELAAQFAGPGVDIINLEMGDIYGPGDTRRKLVDQLVGSCLAGETMEIRKPENVMYPVHVDDAVRAVVAALDPAVPSGRYSVYGPEGAVRVGEVAERLAEELDAEVKFDYRASARTVDRHLSETVELFPAVPGGEAEVDLRTGLVALARSMAQNAEADR